MIPNNMALTKLKDANGNTLHPVTLTTDHDLIYGVTRTDSTLDSGREYNLEDSIDRLTLTDQHEEDDEELGEFGGAKRTSSSQSQNAGEVKRRLTEVCAPPDITFQRTNNSASYQLLPSSSPGPTGSLQTQKNNHRHAGDLQAQLISCGIYTSPLSSPQPQSGHQNTFGPEVTASYGSDLTGSVEADGAPAYSPEDRRRIKDIEMSLMDPSSGPPPPFNLFEESESTSAAGKAASREVRPPPEDLSNLTLLWATSEGLAGPPTAATATTQVGLHRIVKGPPTLPSTGLKGVTGPPSDLQTELQLSRDSGLSGSDSSLSSGCCSGSEKIPTFTTKPQYSSATPSFPHSQTSMSGGTANVAASCYWPPAQPLHRTASVCSSSSSSSCKSKDSGHELSPAASWDGSLSPASESDCQSPGGWADLTASCMPKSTDGVRHPMAPPANTGLPSMPVGSPSDQLVASSVVKGRGLPVAFSPAQGNRSAEQIGVQGQTRWSVSALQQMTSSPSPQHTLSLPVQQVVTTGQRQMKSSLPPCTVPSSSQQLIPSPPPHTGQQMVPVLPLVTQQTSSSQQQVLSSPRQMRDSVNLQRTFSSSQHTTPSPQQQRLPSSPQQTVSSPAQQALSSPVNPTTPSPHHQAMPSPAQQITGSPAASPGVCPLHSPAYQLATSSPTGDVNPSSTLHQHPSFPDGFHSVPAPSMFQRQESQHDVIFSEKEDNSSHCCCCCCQANVVCRGPGGSAQAGSRPIAFSQDGSLPVEVLQTACDENGAWREDEDGDTILHILSALENEAVAISNLKTLKDLPGFAMAINKYNKNLETPLFNAVFFGKVGLVDAFLRLNADPGITCCSTKQTLPLHHAVEKCDMRMVETLLRSRDIDIDVQRPSDRCTPLLVALMMHVHNHRKNDSLQIIKMLVDEGPDFKAVDVRSGKTVMMCAVDAKDPRVLDLILSEVGVDQARDLINMTNRVGNSAVHLAAGLQDDDIKETMLRKLIMSGGETNKKNFEGDSPRDWARNMIDKVARLR